MLLTVVAEVLQLRELSPMNTSLLLRSLMVLFLLSVACHQVQEQKELVLSKNISLGIDYSDLNGRTYNVGDSALLVVDACDFDYGCDCCAADLIFNYDSSFYRVAYCMSDIEVSLGSVFIKDGLVLLDYSGVSLSKEYNWESEVDANAVNYFFWDTTYAAHTEQYKVSYCGSLIQLRSVDDEILVIEREGDNYLESIQGLHQNSFIERIRNIDQLGLNMSTSISKSQVFAQSKNSYFRVDELSGGGLLLRIWNSKLEARRKPDLILENGRVLELGAQEGYLYVFNDKGWKYIIEVREVAKTIEGLGVYLGIDKGENTVNYIKFDKVETSYLKPDTTLLYSIARQNSARTISETYLNEYFLRVGARDSITLFDGDETDTCAFNQQYTKGVLYKNRFCMEGGRDVKLYLPLGSKSEIKNLVEELFYETHNRWINEDEYVPHEMGTGCYYKIIQSQSHSIIECVCVD